MKRNLMRAAAAVSAVICAQGAFAADDVEFKTGGQFRARYENWMTPSASSTNTQSNSDIKSRVKLNITARKGERLQMMVSLLHGAQFGGIARESNVDSAQAADPTTNQNAVHVSRAWGWWKATDNLSLKVGRMGIEIADGSVFSENDWEQSPTFHEGLMAAYDMDFSKISLYLLKNSELNVGTAPVGPGATNGAPNWDPEMNMYMLSFDLKNLPEALKMANSHAIAITRDETTVPLGATPLATSQNAFGNGSGSLPGAGLTEQRVGLTLGGESANIMYKLSGEYVFGAGHYKNGNAGQTVGQDFTISQNMIDALLGYHLADVMGLKVSFVYHRDSGSNNLYNGTAGDRSFNTYDPLFYDLHNYSGMMDIVRWGNLTAYGVTASIMPMDDLEAGIGYNIFQRTENGAQAANTTFGANYASLQGRASEANIGSELDVYANKAYEGNFKIGAHAGLFMPDNYLKNATGKYAGTQDQMIAQFMLHGTMSF